MIIKVKRGVAMHSKTIASIFSVVIIIILSTIVHAQSIFEPQQKDWTWTTPGALDVSVGAGIYWDSNLDGWFYDPRKEREPEPNGDCGGLGEPSCGDDDGDEPLPGSASVMCQWSCTKWTPDESSEVCGSPLA